MRRSGPPFVSNEAFERHASALRLKARRAGLWSGEGAIDPEPIAEFVLGVELVIGDLQRRFGLDEGVLGAAWFEENRIAVDERLDAHEGRRNFTVAHEIGHWVLHRPLWEQHRANGVLNFEADAPVSEDEPLGTLICLQPQPRVRRDQYEYQADRFASAFLMPEEILRAAAAKILAGERVEVEDVLEAVHGQTPDSGMQESVADEFMRVSGITNVSNEAMRRRLHDLGIFQLPNATGRIPGV